MKIARPCKSANVTSGHFSKDEINKRKEVEEKLKGGVSNLKPPAYLSTKQKKIFKYIVKELNNANILGNLDIYILVICSIAIDRLQEIETIINNDSEKLFDKALMSTKDKYTKDLFRCCNELSLSPQSRAKMANINLQAKEQEEDALIKALKGDDDEDEEE